MPRTHAPLGGFTVLDFTRLLPGAYCTLLLADLGAEVIKIEDPRGGDAIRAMHPTSGGLSVYFRALNRNKRSVTLDLRVRDAQPILNALLARADVVVESFRPSTAKRLGIDAATVRDRHPGIVHCAITGFGQTGPYAERAGHDINYVALAGLLALDQPGAIDEGALPHVPRMFLADVGGGAMTALSGILAALVARERTKRGASVDVSMHDAMLSWLTFPAARALIDGGDVGPDDLPVWDLQASYNVYRTADGRFLALGALEPKFWAAFCERLGRPDLTPLQHAPGEAQARVHAEVAHILGERTQAEWLEHFRGVDACLSAVYSVAEALDDPHVRARRVVAEHAGSRFVLSPLAASTHGADHPRVVEAPALGADTDAVLADAGIGVLERRRLRAKGVI